MMGGVGLFALGVFMLTKSNRFTIGLLLILGAISLFSIGLGMRKFADK
jgi:multisubunit Na+/H+ antiporter MnhC subunit